MDSFPAFFPMRGARVVVAGEGEMAEAKARLFAGSPAQVQRLQGAAALDPAAYQGARLAFVAGDDPLSRFVAKPILDRVLRANNEDTRAMETVIRASDTSWTLLRPSRLIAGDRRVGYRCRLDASVWWHYNTTFDTVGRAAVDAISKPDWAGHAVFITE